METLIDERRKKQVETHKWKNKAMVVNEAERLLYRK